MFEDGGPAHVVGLIALFVALSVTTAVVASRLQSPRIFRAFRAMMHTSAQLPLRASLFALGVVA